MIGFTRYTTCDAILLYRRIRSRREQAATREIMKKKKEEVYTRPLPLTSCRDWPVIKNVSVLSPMYSLLPLVSMFLDGRMYVSQCCNEADKQPRPEVKLISRKICRPEVYATMSGDSTCLSALFETRW